MEKNTDEKWQPKLGETVLYKPIRKVRGLMPESRRVIVHAIWADGAYSVKIGPCYYKHVKIDCLSPTET